MIKSEGGGERYAPGILKELVLMFMLQQMQNKISDSKSALQRIRRKATDKMIMRSPIQSSVFGYPMKNQKRKQTKFAHDPMLSTSSSSSSSSS
jgi:hypothetical protein